MRFDIITLFPEMFKGPLEASILRRAQEKGQLEIKIHDLRDSATGNHKTVDDTPYGGGAGMVLKVNILDTALQKVLSQPEVSAIAQENRRTLVLAPSGKILTQKRSSYLAKHYQQITLVCGHYEGLDERFLTQVDDCLSIGEYVLTGGELPALVVIDAVTRLLTGVITEESPEEESFNIQDEDGGPLIEYPHYTRPLEYKGQVVPEILLSGNHAAISAWRLEQAKIKTQQYQDGADEAI